MAESEMERSSPDTVGETDDGTHEFPMLVQTRESYQGPLPPAHELAKYEETLPGLAQTIVDMAQKEQAFRHDATHYGQRTERKVLQHLATKTYLGQVGALLIAMTAIGGGIWLISRGHSAAGIAGIITALVGLVTVFVVGKHYESNEISELNDSGSE